MAISSLMYSHRNRWYASGKTASIPGGETFRLWYPFIRLSTLVGAVLAIWLEAPYGLDLYDSTVLAYVGGVLSAVGLIFFGMAKIRLGSRYSPCFDSFVPPDLALDGIYHYVRHPIYTGNLLWLSGLAIATGSIVILANVLVVGFYYYASAIREEAVLAERFPLYASYRLSTGRFFPRIFKR